MAYGNLHNGAQNRQVYPANSVIIAYMVNIVVRKHSNKLLPPAAAFGHSAQFEAAISVNN